MSQASVSLFGGPPPQGSHGFGSGDRIVTARSDVDIDAIGSTRAAIHHGNNNTRDGISTVGDYQSRASPSELSSNDYWEEQHANVENRFHGSALAYKRYIADERNLLHALQQGDATDLSSHLLAAHRLITPELQHGDDIDAAQRHWLPKQQWHKKGKDVGLPNLQSWTSWPLQPDQVPRADALLAHLAQFGTSAPLSPKDQHNQSWQELHDVLQGTMLRLAREQWQDRRNQHDHSVNKSNDGMSLYSEAEESSDHDTSASATTSRPASRVSTASRVSQRKEVSGDLPVFSADDAQSATILQPIVNSIASELDKVLQALHTSRYSQYTRKAGLKIDRHYNARGTQYKMELSAVDTSGAETEQSHSARESTSLKGRLPARDWSEVLGLAAITGVDMEVLHRTAARCSTLFGEGMEFGIMRGDDPSGKPPRISTYIPSVIPSFDELMTSQPEEQPSWTLDTHLCPHPGCKFSKTALQSKRGLTKHIRNMHGWDPVREQMPEDRLDGVHIDGYLQPVRKQAGWNDKRKKGKADGDEADDTEDDDDASTGKRRGSSRARSRKRRQRSPTDPSAESSSNG